MMRAWAAAIIMGLLPITAQAVVPVAVQNDSLGEAWAIEDHSVPLFSLQLAFPTGTSCDPAGKEGLGLLLGKMLMEGTEQHEALAFRKALEERAIELSVDVGKDMTTVSLSALTEHRDAALDLLAEMLTQPRFDDGSFAIAKERQLAQLRQFGEIPAARAMLRLQEIAFAGHPYGRPRLGSAASIAEASLPALREHFAQMIARGGMIIGMAGDVDPQGMLNALAQRLVAMPQARNNDFCAIADVSPVTTGETLRIDMDVPQTTILIGAPGIKRDDPRFYAATLLNFIVGGGTLQSRLNDSLREKGGLVYSVGTDLQPLRHAGLWIGQLATRREKTSEAQQRITDTFDELRNNGVTDAELEDARNYVLGSQPLELDSSAKLASQLVMMQYFNLGRDYLERRPEYYGKVTHDAVNAMIPVLYDPTTMLRVEVGKAE